MNRVAMTKAWADVCNERARQVFKGYTAEHDDVHDCLDISAAAVCYTQRAIGSTANRVWPFADEMPPRAAGETARDDLVKAAALILAEIERIDREQERAAEIERVQG